jgi:hypothetical protein
MADKKLNEVTKVTDMAYVPVIMADGSVGQIAKSDLATVVAGVLSTKANTPLLHHEGSLYSAENPFDIDSFYMGIVTLNKSSWSSYPVNKGAAPQEDMRGSLFAYRNDNGSGFFGSQVFTSLDNVAYIRNFWGNTMGSWQRIDNFGYNSLAELSAGVASEIGVYYAAKKLTAGEVLKTTKGAGFVVVKAPSLTSWIAIYAIKSTANSEMIEIVSATAISNSSSALIQIFKAEDNYISIKNNHSESINIILHII